MTPSLEENCQKLARIWKPAKCVRVLVPGTQAGREGYSTNIRCWGPSPGDCFLRTVKYGLANPTHHAFCPAHGFDPLCRACRNTSSPNAVGFKYAPLAEIIERYPPSEMRDGFNDNGEETVFYVSNPALGLWAVRERLMRDGGEEADGEGRGADGSGADSVVEATTDEGGDGVSGAMAPSGEDGRRN